MAGFVSEPTCLPFFCCTSAFILCYIHLFACSVKENVGLQYSFSASTDTASGIFAFMTLVR